MILVIKDSEDKFSDKISIYMKRIHGIEKEIDKVKSKLNSLIWKTLDSCIKLRDPEQGGWGQFLFKGDVKIESFTRYEALRQTSRGAIKKPMQVYSTWEFRHPRLQTCF